jgi:hypothetical protein
MSQEQLYEYRKEFGKKLNIALEEDYDFLQSLETKTEFQSEFNKIVRTVSVSVKEDMFGYESVDEGKDSKSKDSKIEKELEQGAPKGF